ncbi:MULTISPECIES: Imm2 family immunity protein [unclassified Pseudomonas]|jgi:hypothetical protein|uniref:Imm2 family immunity protein n=1 Tax=unclassified Pseudomonas TaxID=196821 RepID=UPI000DA6E343|nr:MULTISPECIES: Imm2 family immunity protein [unclassified Pseudomonas]MDW3716533.1 Imm2 family immunity protein [Pseudomonas sp. 2023EL-01195]PZE09843.1 hypothetical protein DMX10_29150 [Pseudomonas sp. 57B-090624]
MEDRVSYGEIRAMFLSCYYNYCKLKLKSSSAWVEGESEAGYAYGELENAFDMPVENLMLEVLALVMQAGRASLQTQKYHKDAICSLLSDRSISDVLEGLPAEEVDEFKADLVVLGLC